MREKTTNNENFDVKTHVEWVNHASIRTRTISVVLVIATVLIGIGFYNSLKWSWARDRIKRVYDTGDRTIFALMDGENHPKFRADSYFVGNDFVEPNFRSFAGKLVNSENDMLSKYIYERLSPTTREQLVKYVNYYDATLAKYIEKRKSEAQVNNLSEQLPEEFVKDYEESNDRFKPTVVLLSSMALDFNKLLKAKDLYIPERFEKIKLHPETKKFLDYTPGGNDLIRFNRLLLEDYFPDEIIRSRNISPEDDYRKEMQQALVIAYTDNIRYIKIPFFGVAFDVNDLGTIGGLGLLIILMMYRFCLSREIKNLRYAFKKSHKKGELEEFYHALAMNQVLTVPEMKNLRRNRRLAVSVLFVPIMTAIIFSAGVFYDWWTVLKQGLYKYNEASFTLWIELVWLPFIWALALICAGRIRHTDKIWRVYWRVLVREKSKYPINPYTKKIRRIMNYVIFLKFLSLLTANYKAKNNFDNDISTEEINSAAAASNEIENKMLPEQKHETPSENSGENSSEQITDSNSNLKKYRDLLIASTSVSIIIFIFLQAYNFIDPSSDTKFFDAQASIVLTISFISLLGTIIATILTMREDKRKEKSFIIDK